MDRRRAGRGGYQEWKAPRFASSIRPEWNSGQSGQTLPSGYLEQKYFSGRFTRTGAVNPLLAEIDDVFVISKTGDELTLSFDALPALPEDKKYTFLLYADGYSKEMDINSGSPDAVLPLPFKQMKKYPYGADEQYPMSEEKRRLYDEYTTRTVKGFLPRIETALIK